MSESMDISTQKRLMKWLVTFKCNEVNSNEFVLLTSYKICTNTNFCSQLRSETKPSCSVCVTVPTLARGMSAPYISRFSF